MRGSRDPNSRLWRVNLKQKLEKHEKQYNHAYEKNNQKYLMNYLHAACFSPVKSTWIAVIKNEYFLSWPGLTEHAMEKHLSKSTATTKGHLNQQRKNARTTQIKTKNAGNQESDIDHGIKTQFVYATTIDAGQIKTDQTGRFSVVSSKGNKYIMILYDYDSNVILAQPIKDRTTPALLKAFQIMEDKLVARSLKQSL
jgi:hypothetical protein